MGGGGGGWGVVREGGKRVVSGRRAQSGSVSRELEKFASVIRAARRLLLQSRSTAFMGQRSVKQRETERRCERSDSRALNEERKRQTDCGETERSGVEERDGPRLSLRVTHRDSWDQSGEFVRTCVSWLDC